jgi:hypothetical protein
MKQNALSVEQITILTQYQSVWGWHMMAIICLVGSLICVSLVIPIFASIWFFALFLMFGIMEFMSYKKRRELYEE